MKNKIKWACIQPLTGGMYLGAEEAIGHPAEWILSYKGLTDIKSDNDNNIINAGNEYNLIEYLRLHDRMPKYYQIYNKAMFDNNITDENPQIYLDGILQTPDYENLDLVVAVPVCSGLSIVTKASDDTKASRNNNMLFITNYTLSVIKPKIYIFENAPTLMSERGDEIRKELKDIAIKFGYSLLFYKTDTALHNNCQIRPRTFVIFQKHISDSELSYPLSYEFVSNKIDVISFFNDISDTLPQSECVTTALHNLMVLDYYNYKFGCNWMESQTKNINLIEQLIKIDLLDDLINYVEQSDKWIYSEKEKPLSYFNHIKYKKSLGKNYYGDDIQLCKEKFPSVQFRSIHNMLHPSGKRLCTTREYLSLMGMPNDFILYGDESNLAKIGQNVPVKTAKFIVEQACNIINNWGSNEQLEKRIPIRNEIFQDNTKQIIKYDF